MSTKITTATRGLDIAFLNVFCATVNYEFATFRFFRIMYGDFAACFYRMWRM
jgi:hypothetical protein